MSKTILQDNETKSRTSLGSCSSSRSYITRKTDLSRRVPHSKSKSKNKLSENSFETYY